MLDHIKSGADFMTTCLTTFVTKKLYSIRVFDTNYFAHLHNLSTCVTLFVHFLADNDTVLRNLHSELDNIFLKPVDKC